MEKSSLVTIKQGGADMQNVVLTGATGAIGNALIQILVQQGTHVFAFVRPGSPRNLQMVKDPLVTKICCALEELDHFDVSGMPKCDAFFHMGWAGTTGKDRDNLFIQNRNVKNSLDAVELASRLGCEVFVGVGSQAEYGRCMDQLTPQTPVFPENGYGMGKLCAGQMTRLRAQQLGLRHVWARILSVYGPHDGMQNLIPSIMASLMRGEPPAATAGEQIWSFLYSEDAADALLNMAESGADGEVYVLGGKERATLKSFLEIVQDVVAPDIKIRFGAIPYREGQVMHLFCDLTKTERDLSWKPHTEFRNGILRTMQWMKTENF